MAADWQRIAAELELRTADAPRRGALDDAEQALGCRFSDSLRALYAQTDGIVDQWGAAYVLPLVDLVRMNREFRVSFGDLYMSFDDLVLFGEQGGGDMFFQPTASENAESVFLWDHEDDSRTWLGRDIEDALRRFTAAEAG